MTDRIKLTKNNTRHPCSVCKSGSRCESPHAIGNRNHHIYDYSKEKPTCFVKTLVFGFASKAESNQILQIKTNTKLKSLV